MARRLQETHGVGLNGAVLISPAIEVDALSGSDYDLTYWVELFPSLAAAAHHHGRAKHPDGTTLEQVREKAEDFARNDLARWLTQGEGLDEKERAKLIRKMSSLIGLPASIIENAGGRIASTIFCRQLLREERRLCGHYDASITAIDPFPDRDPYSGPDPTLFSIDRLFTSGVHHHLRDTLELETDLDYRLLSMEVNTAWKDASRDHVFRKMSGAMDDLRYGMSLNEHMKVFVTHGYYDLVTPYFGSERLTKLMKLTPEQRKNLTIRHFEGGHMFYSWDTSRQAFTEAMESFYASALPSDRA
jgi:carboxypeptidase C (cathepsin A)